MGNIRDQLASMEAMEVFGSELYTPLQTISHDGC